MANTPGHGGKESLYLYLKVEMLMRLKITEV